MKTGFAILAGLLAGILVAAGVLAAFVFVGPDPVGLRPTPAPAPTLVPATPSPSLASPSPSPSLASPSPSPSLASPSPSIAISSPGPSASAAGSPAGSVDPDTAFHIGQPAPALLVPQLGGGSIDLARLRGKPVWLNFMQTTCPDCIDEFPLMNGFSARYADDGLVVIAMAAALRTILPGVTITP